MVSLLSVCQATANGCVLFKSSRRTKVPAKLLLRVVTDYDNNLMLAVIMTALAGCRSFSQYIARSRCRFYLAMQLPLCTQGAVR